MKLSLPKVSLNKRDWMQPTVKLFKRDRYSLKRHIAKRASNVTVKLFKRDQHSVKEHITKRASNVFLTKLDWMRPVVNLLKLNQENIEIRTYAAESAPETVKFDQEEPAPSVKLPQNEQVKVVCCAPMAKNANKENNNNAEPKSSEPELVNGHPVSRIQILGSHIHRRSNYRNYDIDDLNSDDSTDDEDEPKKKIPKWAKGKLLASSAIEQQSMDPEEIFSSVDISDLSNVFLTNRAGVSGIVKLQV